MPAGDYPAKASPASDSTQRHVGYNPQMLPAQRPPIEASTPGGLSASPALSPEPPLREHSLVCGARRLHVLAVLAIAGLVVVSFMPALTAVFVNWDDDDLLLHQTRHRTLSAESLRWMFSTTLAGHWQPLTWLSYWLDWRLWDLEPFGYHLTNVLLHAGSAVLIYWIVRRLLLCAARAKGSPSLNDADFVVPSAFAALVFAVHPLRVESVAWLAERRDCLSGVFYFGCVLFYLRYVHARSGAGGSRPVANYLAALACFGLSLMAKASGVILPLVLLILDIYPLRRGRSRRLLVEKIPFFVAAGAAGVVAVVAQTAQGATYSYKEYGIVPRLAQAVHGLAFYVVKTAWPVDLGPLYPLAPIGHLFGWSLVWNGVIVAGLAAAAWVCRRNWPAITAAIAVYGVQILPVLGFVQSGPQKAADRYSYLACVGLAALAGALVWKVRHSSLFRTAQSRSAGFLFLCLLAITLSHLTFRQSDVWTSSLTLWARGVQIAPHSSIARTNYGDALAEHGNYVAASHEYEQALRLNPHDVIAVRHYAKVLSILGAHEPARAMYAVALKLDPSFAPAYRDLAGTLLALGRPVEAVEMFNRCLQRSPRDFSAMRQLAEVLSAHRDRAVRDPARAEHWARELLRQSGGRDPAALMLLATALGNQRRFVESVEVGLAALYAAHMSEQNGLAREIERRLARFCLGRTYSVFN